MTKKQIAGMGVAIVWIVVVVALALATHKLAVLGLFGLLVLIVLPFRRRS